MVRLMPERYERCIVCDGTIPPGRILYDCDKCSSLARIRRFRAGRKRDGFNLTMRDDGFSLRSSGIGFKVRLPSETVTPRDYNESE